MLAANTILQNRYRIVRLLGKGGMGAVYEAIDERVSCVVALKEYLIGQQSEARQAFQREAALLANLRHSALPKVMDYFDDPQGDFLVMEYIPGHDLAALLALRDAPFPPEQVIRWAIELLKLLEYLHTRDPPILHRDIKPANLKATKEDEIFLLDFGLAKGSAGQMATVETSKSVPGYTPVYAPLEQILGQGTDPRSDLYSLGATLYHLLTGQAPVSAPARFDSVENDRLDPLKPANQLNFRIAADVAALVQKALALSRKDRFGSAGEMRIALELAEQAALDRDTARKAEAALIETLPTVPDDDPAKPLVADKDVQFTVYTPQKIKPEKTYPVLAFAHLSARRADAAPDERDPIEEMKDQAARILGEQRDDYTDVKDLSRQAVPRGGEITFVPVVQGLAFSPAIRSFTWRKSVHREEFDVSASREVDGRTLNGRMTVFLGSVIIAEVPLTFSVDSSASSSAERISLDQAKSARRVQKVFASYSKKDEWIVNELAQLAPIFGSRFVTDRTHLEPGEDRVEGLQRLIRNSDMFQLFWSTNSMRSRETTDEIKYAASLGRPGFILPTHWEEPVPRSPEEGLPPPEIERLQFYRIYPGAISQPGGAAESRVVIMGPTGAEIYVDDERHGSFGRSGRVILKSISPGKHVLRITRSGERDDERVVEILTGDEQVIQTQFQPSRTVGASPELPKRRSEITMSSAFPTYDSVEFTPTAGAFATPRDDRPTGKLPPLGGAPARRKRGLMMPLYAGAALVLLVMIVAPVWFMLNSRTALLTSSAPKPNLANSNKTSNSNSSGNGNNSFGPALDVQFATLEGGTLRLKDFEGRVVLLNFWTTWATPYRKEVPVLNELQNDLGSRGLSVIGISYDDTADAVRQFQKEIPQEYQIGLGGKQVRTELQSTVFPTAYLIDRRGRIRKRIVGGQTRAAFEAAIEPLLSEAP
jgi:serine/threonine protein kinase/peroxiredoxin